MALQHDQAGFLIGEKVLQSNEDILTAQEQNFRVLTRIRSDVSQIARALGVQAKNQARNTRTGYGGQRAAPVAVAAVPAGRGAAATRTAGGNQTAGPQRVAAQASGRRASMSVAVPVGRDSRGRFTAGQKPDGSPAAPRGPAGGDGAMGRLSASISKLSASLPAAEGLDPTVNAFKEVKDAVSPLGRGLFSMFGRRAERKKERWYQRILASLQGKKPAAAPPPQSVGRRGGIGGLMMGGMFGGLGAMLGGIPAMLMGLLTRIFLPIAAIWGSWELGKWIGGKIYEWLDKSGVLPKVFDAFDSIKAAFSSAWESVKSGYETVVSGIEGAWKTITDGFKSALDSFMAFPAKIGEFFSGLDNVMRNLPVIGKAYAAASDAAKAAVSDAKKGYEEGKAGKTDAPPATAVQALARDVGKGVGAAQAVGAQAGAGYDEARGRASDAPAPSGMVQRAARALGGATGTAANWALGKTSERYESGGKGAGTVSTGKGDRGGASYGTYQLASKTGTLDQFLKASGYGAQFAGLTPGTPEFNAKWKEIAARDKGFGAAQHKFIEDTHYSPQMATLQKAGIDLSGRGAAVKDAVWSTSVQFGGKSSLIQKALAGKDHAKMSDAEIVSAIQDYKTANNDSLFRNSSAAVRAGTLARATNEKGALLKLANTATANLPPPVAANIPPAVPAQIPEPAKADIPERLNSGSASGSKISAVIKDKTSQNVGDRGIAHILTGGIGGA